MAENNNVLKLYKGEAHKIRVEKADEFKDSYFLDAYRQALRCFHGIHVDNENTRKNKSNREFNNVIAFCGERGSGKTSAMMSFRNMLADWKNQHTHLSNWVGGEYSEKTPAELRFVCLEAVDPSRFEPNDRLSGTVLSELYNLYRDKTKGNTPNGKLDLQKKLEKAFSKLLRGIQLLSAKDENPFGDPRSHENDFEVLESIAGAAGLRGAFHDLVKSYLQFSHEDETCAGIDNTYLVIPVDDLDLSVEHAFNLAEDIRKYLHVPNVIILIATKLDQLRLSVEQANYIRFKGIRDAAKRPDEKYVEEMSNMYLEKLIPMPKRIVLPTFGKVEDAKKQKIYFGKRLDSLEAEKDQAKTAESTVLSLIKEKTLLDFRPDNGELHPLVPKTIRELQNLIEYLSEFESPDRSNPLSYQEPLRKFREYFFEHWVPNALERQEEELMGKIISANPTTKNAVAVHHLGRYLTKGWKSMNPLTGTRPINIDQFEQILSTDANNANISLGDVLFLLAELARVDRSRRHGNLIFAVRALYSMEIIKLILIGDEHSHPFDARSDMGDLLGGAYFHPHAFSFVSEPTKSQKVDQRPAYWPKHHEIKELDEYSKQPSKPGTKAAGANQSSTPTTFLPGLSGDQIRTRPIRGKGIPHFLSAIQKSIAAIGPNTKLNLDDPTQVQDLELILSFLYIGELTYSPSLRNEPSRWYLQPTNLTGGKIPYYYLIDFKSFMFWRLVPALNRYRIYNRRAESPSRYEDDHESYEELNLPEAENETSNSVQATGMGSIESQKILLAKVFQIDVLEQICGVACELIKRKRKYTTDPRSLSYDVMDIIDGFEKAMLLIAKQGLSPSEALLPKIEIPKKEPGFQFDDLFYPIADATSRLRATLEEIEQAFFHEKIILKENPSTSPADTHHPEGIDETPSEPENAAPQDLAQLSESLRDFVKRIRKLSEGIHKPDIVQLRVIKAQIISKIPADDTARKRIMDIPINLDINIFSPKRHEWCQSAIRILERRIKEIGIE